ncbi:MFS multidrug transporter-like protein [Xylogone sp. PMI_703]|nr:MFS multidrug transporter-like protein [Xylogone sp. PMI_703]
MASKLEESSSDMEKDKRDSVDNSDMRDPEQGGAGDDENQTRDQSPNSNNSATDWNGPDDPENPFNWPKWKRVFHILPPALISFSATLGASIYTPSYPEIMERYHVGSTTAILPLSLYVLALGFGPLIGAPLSESHGRHFIYLISAPLGALFTMGAGFSQNMASLCILRFFAGLVFSPCLAIGGGTVADVFRADRRAMPSAFFIFSPFLGPALGPVIGSFVTVRKHWRWTQWTLIFFAIFSWLPVLFSEETHKATILKRRSKRLGLPPPKSPFPSRWAKAKFLATVTLIRPVHMLFTEPIVAFLSLYVAFNFGVLFNFFAAFPYVFKKLYDFDTDQAGLVFLAIGIGCTLALPTVIFCDRYFYQPRVVASRNAGHGGVVPPEYRLFPAMAGSFGLPVALFWFAWTARKDISWASPVVAAVPFAWGNLCVFISAATYLLDTYQALTGASALAANGLLRYILGAAFPLFALQMYENLGIDWATSLLAFVTVALLPIPWVLFRYGHKIRSKSKYDTIKI